MVIKASITIKYKTTQEFRYFFLVTDENKKIEKKRRRSNDSEILSDPKKRRNEADQLIDDSKSLPAPKKTSNKSEQYGICIGCKEIYKSVDGHNCEDAGPSTSFDVGALRQCIEVLNEKFKPPTASVAPALPPPPPPPPPAKLLSSFITPKLVIGKKNNKVQNTGQVDLVNSHANLMDQLRERLR